MDVSNASAVVTGGAGGFGGAAVRRLAALGARVVIADIAEDRGRALADEVGNGAVFVRMDCLDEASIQEAVAAAEAMGPLRVAVTAHNGPPAPPANGRTVSADNGRTVDANGDRLPVSNFRHLVEVYLTSFFAVTSIAAEAMAKTQPLEFGQRGVLINTASSAGFEAFPGLVAYSAAKAGVIGMTLTIARDLEPYGIRAMALAPGTFITGGAYPTPESVEQAKARWAHQVLAPKRMGEPDEFGKLVAHVVENDFLNGTTIRLDGGLRF